MSIAAANEPRESKARGIAYLLLAVGLFGSVDGFSKMLVATQSFGQIMLSRYALPLLALLLFARVRKSPRLFPIDNLGFQIGRALLPISVGGLMVFAVKYLPLADATVILFAGPFIVVALSGIFLGEHVPATSWLGVIAGFIAVLLVARPGFTGLSAYAIFPALAALFYALLQIASRRLGTLGADPISTLAWTLLTGTIVSFPLAAMDWQPLDTSAWLTAMALGTAFGLGQYFLAAAFTFAPANVLTPFSYFQILAAVLFGIIAWGDIPNAWTLAGIALIICAGVYLVRRDISS